MHIGFISGAYPPQHDGIADYTARLAHALSKADSGIRVSVITSAAHASQEAEEVVAIYRIVKRWNIFGIAAVIRCALKQHVDIIHIQFPSVAYRKTLLFCVLPLLLRMCCPGVKVIVTLHEFSVSRPLNRARQFILSICSHRVIVTDAYEYALVNRLLGVVGRVSTIPIGSNIARCAYDASEKPALLRECKLDHQSFIVTFFGVIHPDKGFECFLRALSHIGSSIPAQALVISELNPAHNEYHARITRLKDALGISIPVAVTGYEAPEKVSRLLFASDICVLTFVDGVSLRRGTLMAELAHHKPIIATRRLCGCDALSDQENILFVPIGDDHELAQAIVTLYRDSALRSTLSQGAAVLAKEFSWERIANSHLEVYNKIMNKKIVR